MNFLPFFGQTLTDQAGSRDKCQLAWDGPSLKIWAGSGHRARTSSHSYRQTDGQTDGGGSPLRRYPTCTLRQATRLATNAYFQYLSPPRCARRADHWFEMQWIPGYFSSLSQIGHRTGGNTEKTCPFGLSDPEGPKDCDLDPGLMLVWSISTKARVHAYPEAEM